jgi:hypothetical protein
LLTSRLVEPCLERKERAHFIRELLAHLRYLRQIWDEVSPKRLDGRAHPTFVKETDRILDELSTLIKEKVQHIADLQNPYAREMYYERKSRITSLLKSLKLGSMREEYERRARCGETGETVSR